MITIFYPVIGARSLSTLTYTSVLPATMTWLSLDALLAFGCGDLMTTILLVSTDFLYTVAPHTL